MIQDPASTGLQRAESTPTIPGRIPRCVPVYLEASRDAVVSRAARYGSAVTTASGGADFCL